MTKIILASLFFLAPLAAFSQPVIYFDHSNGGGNSSILCTSNAPNVWGATSGLGDGLASISYSTVSNCWVVSGLSSGGEWTQISPQYPTTGALAQLYNASGPITGYFGTYYLHFSGFVAPVIPPPSLTAWTTTTTNFWTTPGDVVYFSGSGRNKSASPNTNQLTLSIDGNPIFTGPSRLDAASRGPFPAPSSGMAPTGFRAAGAVRVIPTIRMPTTPSWSPT
jgi:hypothetical protein